MEIIHLILGKGNPLRMNGVNKVVHELATRQHLAGMPVSVWGVAADTNHDYPERVFPTVLYRRQRFAFALDGALKGAIAAKKGKAVFHLHGGFIPMMYRAARLFRRYGIPFVFTPHGSYNVLAMQKSRRTKQLYVPLFEKPLLKAATTIHVLGASETEGLQAWYPNAKTVRIPYGFELPASGRETKLPATPFTIGFCGRIDVFTKGLDALVEGFARFHQAQPGSRLWIIGGGEELEELRQLALAHGCGESIVFYGPKFGAEKEALLRQCHVFAHPSRNEGLPTAVLEAAALGIPCLVTKATNTGESVAAHEAGIVMAHTDAQELCEGLAALHRQIVAAQQGEALRQRAIGMVKADYSWERLLAAYGEMYARTAGG